MRRATLVGIVLVGGTLVGAGAFVLSPPVGIVDAALTTTTLAPIAVETTVPPTTLPLPSSTTTTTLAPRPVVIHAVGDVNFDTSYVPNLATHGYEYAFAGLDGLFADDDLTIINLECSPSLLGSPLPKEFTFRCDPASLPVARAAVSTSPISPTTTGRTSVPRPCWTDGRT